MARKRRKRRHQANTDWHEPCTNTDLASGEADDKMNQDPTRVFPSTIGHILQPNNTSVTSACIAYTSNPNQPEQGVCDVAKKCEKGNQLTGASRCDAINDVNSSCLVLASCSRHTLPDDSAVPVTWNVQKDSCINTTGLKSPGKPCSGQKRARPRVTTSDVRVRSNTLPSSKRRISNGRDTTSLVHSAEERPVKQKRTSSRMKKKKSNNGMRLTDHNLDLPKIYPPVANQRKIWSDLKKGPHDAQSTRTGVPERRRSGADVSEIKPGLTKPPSIFHSKDVHMRISDLTVLTKELAVDSRLFCETGPESSEYVPEQTLLRDSSCEDSCDEIRFRAGIGRTDNSVHEFSKVGKKDLHTQTTDLSRAPVLAIDCEPGGADCSPVPSRSSNAPREMETHHCPERCVHKNKDKIFTGIKCTPDKYVDSIKNEFLIGVERTHTDHEGHHLSLSEHCGYVSGGNSDGLFTLIDESDKRARRRERKHTVKLGKKSCTRKSKQEDMPIADGGEFDAAANDENNHVLSSQASACEKLNSNMKDDYARIDGGDMNSPKRSKRTSHLKSSSTPGHQVLNELNDWKGPTKEDRSSVREVRRVSDIDSGIKGVQNTRTTTEVKIEDCRELLKDDDRLKKDDCSDLCEVVNDEDCTIIEVQSEDCYELFQEDDDILNDGDDRTDLRKLLKDEDDGSTRLDPQIRGTTEQDAYLDDTGSLCCQYLKPEQPGTAPVEVDGFLVAESTEPDTDTYQTLYSQTSGAASRVVDKQKDRLVNGDTSMPNKLTDNSDSSQTLSELNGGTINRVVGWESEKPMDEKTSKSIWTVKIKSEPLDSTLDGQHNTDTKRDETSTVMENRESLELNGTDSVSDCTCDGVHGDLSEAESPAVGAERCCGTVEGEDVAELHVVHSQHHHTTLLECSPPGRRQTGAEPSDTATPDRKNHTSYKMQDCFIDLGSRITSGLPTCTSSKHIKSRETGSLLRESGPSEIDEASGNVPETKPATRYSVSRTVTDITKMTEHPKDDSEEAVDTDSQQPETDLPQSSDPTHIANRGLVLKSGDQQRLCSDIEPCHKKAGVDKKHTGDDEESPSDADDSKTSINGKPAEEKSKVVRSDPQPVLVQKKTVKIRYPTGEEKFVLINNSTKVTSGILTSCVEYPVTVAELLAAKSKPADGEDKHHHNKDRHPQHRQQLKRPMSRGSHSMTNSPNIQVHVEKRDEKPDYDDDDVPEVPLKKLKKITVRSGPPTATTLRTARPRSDDSQDSTADVVQQLKNDQNAKSSSSSPTEAPTAAAASQSLRSDVVMYMREEWQGGSNKTVLYIPFSSLERMFQSLNAGGKQQVQFKVPIPKQNNPAARPKDDCGDGDYVERLIPRSQKAYYVAGSQIVRHNGVARCRSRVMTVYHCNDADFMTRGVPPYLPALLIYDNDPSLAVIVVGQICAGLYLVEPTTAAGDLTQRKKQVHHVYETVVLKPYPTSLDLPDHDYFCLAVGPLERFWKRASARLDSINSSMSVLSVVRHIIGNKECRCFTSRWCQQEEGGGGGVGGGGGGRVEKTKLLSSKELDGHMECLALFNCNCPECVPFRRRSRTKFLEKQKSQDSSGGVDGSSGILGRSRMSQEKKKGLLPSRDPDSRDESPPSGESVSLQDVAGDVTATLKVGEKSSRAVETVGVESGKYDISPESVDETEMYIDVIGNSDSSEPISHNLNLTGNSESHKSASKGLNVARNSESRNSASKALNVAENSESRESASRVLDIAENSESRESASRVLDVAGNSESRESASRVLDVAENSESRESASRVLDVAENSESRESASRVLDVAENSESRESAFRVLDVAGNSESRESASRRLYVAENSESRESASRGLDVEGTSRGLDGIENCYSCEPAANADSNEPQCQILSTAELSNWQQLSDAGSVDMIGISDSGVPYFQRSDATDEVTGSQKTCSQKLDVTDDVIGSPNIICHNVPTQISVDKTFDAQSIQDVCDDDCEAQTSGRDPNRLYVRFKFRNQRKH
ncbi:uncharacterized protein LOC121386300 [Gigantopelta aegis]|uniref:uncharacterized protein LOC121386300 n=1 Tax=Gigantopelta aegis TaxID=1735272 RepID=UPI001B88929E|nr:uncharacterized protein LOC121386300 [Gigantopelta aegis]